MNNGSVRARRRRKSLGKPLTVAEIRLDGNGEAFRTCDLGLALGIIVRVGLSLWKPVPHGLSYSWLPDLNLCASIPSSTLSMS
jgi:hypothetical protein